MKQTSCVVMCSRLGVTFEDKINNYSSDYSRNVTPKRQRRKRYRLIQLALKCFTTSGDNFSDSNRGVLFLK